MFEEMVKRNFPFFGLPRQCWKHFWSKTKLDLENFHHISFLHKALNVMFDLEMVKRNFPFEKNLDKFLFDLENFIFQDNSMLKKFWT